MSNWHKKLLRFDRITSMEGDSSNGVSVTLESGEIRNYGKDWAEVAGFKEGGYLYQLATSNPDSGCLYVSSEQFIERFVLVFSMHGNDRYIDKYDFYQDYVEEAHDD